MKRGDVSEANAGKGKKNTDYSASVNAPSRADLCDVDKEKAILAHMVIFQDVIPELQGRLKGSEFYNKEFGQMYTLFIELFMSNNLPEDPDLLADRLLENGVTKAKSHATAVVDGLFSTKRPIRAASLYQYADKVHDLAEQRYALETVESLNETLAKVAAGELDSEQMWSEMQGKIIAAKQEGSDGRGLALTSDLLGSVDDTLNAYALGQVGQSGLPTGIETLDEILSINPENFVIIAARPSVGKSALAVNIALNVAKQDGRPVYLFSLEMSNTELLLRMTYMLSRVNKYAFEEALQRVHNSKYQDGYQKEELQRYVQACMKRMKIAREQLSKLPIYLCDSASSNVLDISAFIRRKQAEIEQKYGVTAPSMVIIDYIQLMTPVKKSASRQEDVSDISRSIKILAKEIKAPVIGLSQLNRETEIGGNKRRPKLANLRESGSLEQDADAVVFIHRPDMDERKKGDDESIARAMKAEIIVEKQRSGPTGTAHCIMDDMFTLFRAVPKWDKQNNDMNSDAACKQYFDTVHKSKFNTREEDLYYLASDADKAEYTGVRIQSASSEQQDMTQRQIISTDFNDDDEADALVAAEVKPVAKSAADAIAAAREKAAALKAAKQNVSKESAEETVPEPFAETGEEHTQPFQKRKPQAKKHNVSAFEVDDDEKSSNDIGFENA